VTVTGGVATFVGLSDNTAQIISLEFSGDGLTAGPSTNITVIPAAAYQLVIQPAVSDGDGRYGVRTQPVVYELDQYGTSRRVTTAR